MANEQGKAVYCHFEVVNRESRYITEEGLYLQQNRTYLGFEGVIPPHPVVEISFPHEGPDAILWLIRGGRAEALATRAGQRIARYDNQKVEWLGAFGVNVPVTSSWLKAGDGFVVTALEEKCEAGPTDRRDGWPRPTVYQ